VANEEHLAQLKQGVEAWNQWREANFGIQPDLSGADLRGADLRQADLGGADLRQAPRRRGHLPRLRHRSLGYCER
jgi:hypothetical protein